jgi:hypothetical protein
MKNRFIKKILILSFLITSYVSITKSSEFIGNYSLIGGYDSNPLINNNPLESAILRNSIGLKYLHDESGFSSKYTGSVMSFLNILERNYHAHNIRADYTFQPFTYPYFVIESIAEGKLRNNSVDGLLYNYAAINPELAFILYSDIGIIRFAYSPSFSRFCNYPSLSNSQNEFNISLDKTLEIETNLIAGASYGSRNYYNAPLTFRNISNSENEVPKYMYFLKNSNGRELPNSVYTNQLTNIVDFYAGINYPITTEILVGLKGNFNFHLNDDGLYYASGAIDLYNEREFFDDNYNFQEQAITASAKFDMNEFITISVNYTINNRDFLYSLSLINSTYSFEEKRKDTGNLISGELKYIFAEYFSIFSKMSINLKIDYFSNDSNLKEYTFQTGNILVSTNWEF